MSNGYFVSYAYYENEIIAILGDDMSARRHTPAIEYHFCEYIEKELMEDKRWEEVFLALYGYFPKI